MKQTKEATDRDISLDFNGTYVNLGDYSDIVHGHNNDLRISWSLKIERDENLTLQDPSTNRITALVSSEMLEVGGQVRWGPLGAQSSRLQYTLVVRMQRMSPVNAPQIRRFFAIFGGDHPSESIH